MEILLAGFFLQSIPVYSEIFSFFLYKIHSLKGKKYKKHQTLKQFSEKSRSPKTYKKIKRHMAYNSVQGGKRNS
jgi:hypothetical protein